MAAADAAGGGGDDGGGGSKDARMQKLEAENRDMKKTIDNLMEVTSVCLSVCSTVCRFL